jgi:hypothetical protein
MNEREAGTTHRVVGAEFGPDWHDPALDVPFHCPWCGKDGTREDVVAIAMRHDTDPTLERTGFLCCWCFNPVWDEREEP